MNQAQDIRSQLEFSGDFDRDFVSVVIYCD